MDKKKSKKSELEKNLSELEDNLKRSLADYQNLEKRFFEERKELVKNANKGLILRLLPALDTLMLANKHVRDEGLNLSIRQVLDILRNEGVEKIETKGRDFDPRIMECTEVVAGEANKVIEELRPGYLLNDAVFRPAQVKVGKASS